MLVTAIFCSILFGIFLTLAVQFLILHYILQHTPPGSKPRKPQFVDFSLPKELLSAIKTKRPEKETCVALNLVFHFLFKELRDAKSIRKWVIKKMNVEFTELMQKTTGRLIEQISVQDFSLGPTFPVIKTATVKDVKLQSDSLEQVDIELDLDYQGGFQLAIEVDMVFGKRRVYLSVMVTKLQGRARLQFTREPYTHWSFSFYEEPLIEFDVESKYGGRSLPRITTLIITQLKRTIRKRHTLPNYKFRMKPFFQPPPPPIDDRELHLRGVNIGQGKLEVTVQGCYRLTDLPEESSVYCTLSIDSQPWSELTEGKKKVWVVYDLEIIKGQSASIGLTFRDDFVLDKYADMVIIDSVAPDSPAGQVDIRKGDVLTSIGTTKVTSTKQAAKLFKNSGERLKIKIERLKTKASLDVHYTEDSVSLMDLPADGSKEEKISETSEEYVNINIKGDSDVKVTNHNRTESEVKVTNVSSQQSPPSSTSSPQKRVMSLVSSGRALLQRRGRRSQTESAITLPKRDQTSQSQTKDSPQQGRVHSDSSPQIGRPQPDSPQSKFVLSSSPSSSPRLGRKNLSDKDLKDLTTPKKQQDFTGSLKLPPKRELNVTRSRSQSDTTSVKSYKSDDLDSELAEMDSEEEEEDIDSMIKTVDRPSTENPVWNEKFAFSIGPQDKFLNVCVWCKVPKKVDKNDRVLKASKDFVVGHVCLSLLDISLDCLMTLQGDNEVKVKLSPSEERAGASRAKMATYASHPGFIPDMSHGDIKLAFIYTPNDMSEAERKNCTRDIPVLRPKTEVKVKQGSDPDLESRSERGKDKEEEEGRHSFDRTNFTTATYCNFCGRKIWLKAAFRCSVCNMICHKKCVQKCQAETLCTEDGAKKRSNPSEPWKPPVSQSEERNIRQEVNQRTSRIIKKFRREPTKQNAIADEESNIPSTPEKQLPSITAKPLPHTVPPANQLSPFPSPTSIRRRNSAPNSEAQSGLDQSDISTLMPQTRSINSLHELLSKTIATRESSREFKSKDKHSSCETSDDSDIEMDEMIQLAQQHRSKGQNLDEMVVTAAKEMGKELFAELSLEERKEKLDSMVMKLQKEIDIESENKNELIKAMKETIDHGQKEVLKHQIEKSNEKVEAMMMMMLHYCAGLQYCLDQEEEEKQKSASRKSSFTEEAEPVSSSGATDEEVFGNVSKEGNESSRQLKFVGSGSGTKEKTLHSKDSRNAKKGQGQRKGQDKEKVKKKSIESDDDDWVDASLSKSSFEKDPGKLGPHSEPLANEGEVFKSNSANKQRTPSIAVEHVSPSSSVMESLIDSSGSNSTKTESEMPKETVVNDSDCRRGAYGDEFRLRQDESEILDDELVSEVLQTVTELIEASEGGTDSSDDEDLITSPDSPASKIV